ncbi:RNA polymerase, beta subunit [anaerobic digester metagenome]|uniref:DNA-directed RNA polymerase n=1 Tax=anaerobic digester metagenome TaxID=1263854 RepID=A0A485LW37_9ZZZZ
MIEQILLDPQLRRKSFAKREEILEIPDLVELPKKSYSAFLQKDVPPEKRKDIGLQTVFKSVFPIKDFNEDASLEFVEYRLGEPKYDIDECIQKGMTYAASVTLKVRLVVWDRDEETGTQSIRDIKEQEVYFGEIPLMTPSSTFIINGTERVIVSQLHRSPGIFFDKTTARAQSGGRVLYSARIIPARGSWIDLDFDTKGILYLRIDRRRKMPVTTLLKAMGFSNQEILGMYYPTHRFEFTEGKVLKHVDVENMKGMKVDTDIKIKGTDEVILKAGRKVTPKLIKRMQGVEIEPVIMEEDDLLGKILAEDIVNISTGEIIADANDEITRELLDQIHAQGITQVRTIYYDEVSYSSSLSKTLALDKVDTPEEAIIEIYRRLRPSNPPTLEIATNFFENLFFNPAYYDLSRVGRMKINQKLGVSDEEAPLDMTVLRKEDILYTVRYLLELKDGVQGRSVDDIDHMSNRRVRSVGELLENQYRIGLVRMERAIKERMSLQDVETMMPNNLINPKPVSAVIREFFGSGQLSQFMDQTNPLSAITHKRRLSALGPGGLTRERAVFEVRDVHPSHYGRVCPIETPEGPNIGLIVSLSTYAKVNEFGFIETPYYVVKDGVVTGEIRYLSAIEEDHEVIVQATEPLDEHGRIIADMVRVRVRNGEYSTATREQVTLMDVATNQLFSVSANLVPFLEHDDANRALMGANMQRQAVPLLFPKPPMIGTGMEQVVARDSGVCVVARRSGTVQDVDSERIVIMADDVGEDFNDTGIDIYRLIKFKRANQNTSFNQKPIVKKGQKVKRGEIIADGPATKDGELALGRNLTVAFMPWGGYNYEDAILISERVVKEDFYTSVHIEEFEVMARDVKLGSEEITRDIPNAGEEALKDLDESGIVRIGAEVKPGDILVGKVTPKGETQLSPEEKLLRAIFGEKASEVKDSSLRVPPGIEGTVIDARVFNRRGQEKDERTRQIEEKEIEDFKKDQEDEVAIITDAARGRLVKLLTGKKLAGPLLSHLGDTVIAKSGAVIDADMLTDLSIDDFKDIRIVDGEEIEAQVEEIISMLDNQKRLINSFYDSKIEKLSAGDDLPPGVNKMVKVYVAIKRKLSVGDKMAGRHGNKGVISRILPEEDMPFFADGRPVDIVLNPLGVPSRMNVGQVLETHLGWGVKGIGDAINRMIEKELDENELKSILKKFYTSKKIRKILDQSSREELMDFARAIRDEGLTVGVPVFDSATEQEIQDVMRISGIDDGGRVVLYDGRTGEPFDSKVSVGVMYMLKLHHLVDDKIHARSIGPYSLVTQQPLGGKAQFGGQRLGEMEVWAIEAYGAAYSLQEFLTVKSDDVAGRTRMYESIVKGQHELEPGIPESFNVLTRELKSLGLDIGLIEGQGQH